MAKAKEGYYVDPDEFKAAIAVYYDTEDCTNYLGECLNKISRNLSFSPCFINYSYKDEMIGDAIVKMFSALKRKKFNVDNGTSPHAYFTTIALHAFINRIKKEKKHHQTITEYKEKVYFDTMQQDCNGGHIYVKPTVLDIEASEYSE